MRNKLNLLVISIILLLISTTMSKAAAISTATLKINKDKVKPGDTFTVTLSVTCEEGINGIDTMYSYDEDKLELVSASVKDSTNWSSLGADKQITVICNSTSKITTADVYVLTFKLKDTVEIGTTASISTTDILVDSDAATDSETTIKALNVLVTAEIESSNNGDQVTGEGNTTEKPDNIVGEDVETEKPSNTVVENTEIEKPINTTGGTNNKNSNDTNSIQKTNIDNSVTKLPKTGKSEIVLLIAGILIIVSVFSYKKYNKYRGV